MAIDWEFLDPVSPAGIESAWVAADGTAYLAVYRTAKPRWRYTIITGADTAPTSALLQTDLGLCSAGRTAMAEGRYVTRIYEHNTSVGGGLRAGEIATFRPSLYLHADAGVAHDFSVGSLGIIDLLPTFSMITYAWNDGSRIGTLWTPDQDDGLQQGPPVLAGGAMFWDASTLAFSKVHVYTPADGVRDFLSAGLSVSHGIGDIGTDAHDVVWTDAQGRSDANSPYATYTIFTAPFTTSPGAVSPRRLRTEEGPLLGQKYTVGCGFAARYNGKRLRIVRLLDGQSWLLEGQDNIAKGLFTWLDPYAITCTEVFARVYSGGIYRVARLRLDSLGPGLPPD